MKNLILGVSLTLLLASCATTEQLDKPKEIDPRQGEVVSRVCFTGNMDGWSTIENDSKALIVYGRRHEPFKLQLIGTCDPEWAMMRIATIQRGGSNCLSRGDKVVTDADMNIHDSCTITKIFKWHPEKLVEAEAEPEEGKEAEKPSTTEQK